VNKLRARTRIARIAGLTACLLGLCSPARRAAAQVTPAPPPEAEQPPLQSGPPPSGSPGSAQVEQPPSGAEQPLTGSEQPAAGGAQPPLAPVEQAPQGPAEQPPQAPAEPPPLVPAKPVPPAAQPPVGLPALPRVSYEWQRTLRLLAAEQLEVEPAPQHKRIAFIRIVRDDVFVPDELWPTWLNWFHGRTRESVVQRELLFEKGLPYDEARIEETMRNLRGMGIFSLVRIVPVQTGKPGEVGVLVHTRDIWSLRLEQDYNITNQFNNVLVRLTELNAFGHNKTVSVDATFIQKSYTIAQAYYARRVLGSSLAVSERAGLIFERESNRVEGNLWSLRFGQPYYSLKQRYSWLASVSREDRVIRSVQGTTVLPFPAEPGYPGPYTLRQYRRQYQTASLYGDMRLGERVKQTFSAGWDYRRLQAQPIAVPVELQEAFEQRVLPKQRRDSGPGLSYDFFTPTWVTFVNLSTYGQSENVRVGPRALFSTRLPLKIFGSSSDSWVMGGELGWTLAPRGALIDMRGSISGRYEGGRFVDRRTLLLLRGASPVFSVFRLVGSISFDLRKRDTQNTYVTLGADSGLRGYPSQALTGIGAHRAACNFELRTLPVQWRAVQLGGVIFYDVGSVYGDLDEFHAYHAVGIGARLLFPQFNRYPFTFDFGASFDPGFRIVPSLQGGQFVPITAAEDPQS
jgi:hypothetical protein